MLEVIIELVVKAEIQLLLRLDEWLENWRVMLISTKIVVEVEVEIGKNEFDQAYLWGFCCSFSIYSGSNSSILFFLWGGRGSG